MKKSDVATPSVRAREACCFQNRNTGGYSWVHGCPNDTQNSVGAPLHQDDSPGKHLFQVNTQVLSSPPHLAVEFLPTSSRGGSELGQHEESRQQAFNKIKHLSIVFWQPTVQLYHMIPCQGNINVFLKAYKFALKSCSCHWLNPQYLISVLYNYKHFFHE